MPCSRSFSSSSSQRDEFAPQVAPLCDAVLHQRQPPWLRKASHRGKRKDSKSSSQFQPTMVSTRMAPSANVVVAAGHGVLRGVRDDDQQQDVGDADGADVAAQDEAEDQEQQPVDQRAAQHELRHRHVDLEQVRNHGLASPGRAAWSSQGPQRTRLRVIRLTIASSTTAPRKDTSNPARLMSPELMRAGARPSG